MDAGTEIMNHCILTLNRYLEGEHMTRCTYTGVSSSLADIPFPFVYLNGTKTNLRTSDGKLPGTDITVNGKQIYQDALRFFTSVDITPDDVYDLGWTLLNKLYPQVRCAYLASTILARDS